MFDVGFLELMLIGIVALVVIGPERLPDVARTVGTWINKAQRFVRGVKSDLASELNSGELKNLLGDQRKQINELRQMVQSTKRELEQTTSDAVKSARSAFDDMEESAADAGIVKPRHPARKSLPAAQPATVAAESNLPESGSPVSGSLVSSSLVSGSPESGSPESGSPESSRLKPSGSEVDSSTAPAGTTPVSLGKREDGVAEPAGVPAQASTGELASDAVSRPVNAGPRKGSWASGVAEPDASTRGSGSSDGSAS